MAQIIKTSLSIGVH